MNTCINCGHEVRRNYYGGWIHANQWQDYCNVILHYNYGSLGTGKKECGCTIPIG